MKKLINLVSGSVELFSGIAMSRNWINYLKKYGTKEQLLEEVGYWNDKMMLGKFLHYLNPLKIHNEGFVARESRRILSEKYNTVA